MVGTCSPSMTTSMRAMVVNPVQVFMGSPVVCGEVSMGSGLGVPRCRRGVRIDQRSWGWERPGDADP